MHLNIAVFHPCYLAIYCVNCKKAPSLALCASSVASCTILASKLLMTYGHVRSCTLGCVPFLVSLHLIQISRFSNSAIWLFKLGYFDKQNKSHEVCNIAVYNRAIWQPTSKRRQTKSMTWQTWLVKGTRRCPSGCRHKRRSLLCHRQRVL